MSTGSDPVHDAVDRYGPLIMRIIWRITRNEEDARDLFQETFLRLHAVMKRGERITHLKAWVCRTALNLSLNWQRRRDHAQAYAEKARRNGHPTTDGDEDMEQRLLMDQVRILSARLPDRQREVFVLRNFEGLSFAEIGDILVCTPETARANEYQALRKIRTWMSESHSRKRVES